MTEYSLGNLIKGLPTPLARCLLRLVKASNPRDRYDCCLFLAEALIKFSVVLATSMLRTVDPTCAYFLEYRLIKRASLGEWVGTLRSTLKELTKHEQTPWCRTLLGWGESGENGWFENTRSALRVVLESINPGQELKIHSPLQIIDNLVTVRNKTRHGAKTDSFYRENVSELESVLRLLLLNSEHVALPLYSQVQSSFTEARVLLGPAPHETVSVPRLPKEPKNELFVYLEAPELAFRLPPFLKYEDETGKVWFANDALKLPQERCEFIDYFDGETKARKLEGYASEPISPGLSITEVSRFPAGEPSYTSFGAQTIRPAVIEAAARLQRAEWHCFPLAPAHEGRVPRLPGVYSLGSHVQPAGLDMFKIVGYVGQATDLRQRFGDYLREKSNPEGRSQVREFLNRFPRIHFYYTVVADAEDRDSLEDWLIKVIDPPANIKRRLQVSVETASKEN